MAERRSKSDVPNSLPVKTTPRKGAKSAEPAASEAADRLFHALGDPTRRAMLEGMAFGPRSVSVLAARSELTLAAVLQHLQILESSGLVLTRKKGRVRVCEIDLHGLREVMDWLETLRPSVERQLERMHELAVEQYGEKGYK